jgi:hypothetical protein
MRSDIVPGGKFPDYELPDHTKAASRLRAPNRMSFVGVGGR